MRWTQHKSTAVLLMQESSQTARMERIKRKITDDLQLHSDTAGMHTLDVMSNWCLSGIEASSSFSCTHCISCACSCLYLCLRAAELTWMMFCLQPAGNSCSCRFVTCLSSLLHVFRLPYGRATGAACNVDAMLCQALHDSFLPSSCFAGHAC